MKKNISIILIAAAAGIFPANLLLGQQPPIVAPVANDNPAASAEKTSEDTDIYEKEDEQLTIEQEQTKEAAQEVKETNSYWSAPDFSKQDGSVGWSPSTFEIPPGFQRRVNFWIDVYTKYTTHQVLLHDAQYLDI